MSESIPDVILRLARQHVPVDATVPVSPARADIESSELLIDAPTLLPREPESAAIDEHVPTASVELRPATVSSDHEPSAAVSNSRPFAVDPSYAGSLEHPGVQSEEHIASADQLPRSAMSAHELRLSPASVLPHGGTPQPALTPHAADPYPSVSATESFVSVSDPVFEQPHALTPSFNIGTNSSYRRGDPMEDFADDAFEPFNRSTATAGSSSDPSPVDAVSESSRQLEQTAHDLETSLTHLFTAQIETLQRLRDRIDEHERRWVEQQGARRAAL